MAKPLYHRVKNALGKNNIASDYAGVSRDYYLTFYINYFRDMIVNFYEWTNLPYGIDSFFVEETLFNQGFAGLVYDESTGLLLLDGVLTGGMNIYNRPMHFRPNIKGSPLTQFSKDYKAVYDFYDFDTQEDKTVAKDEAIILRNNYRMAPYHPQILMFATKLADIEMTIELNRRAQITPYIIKTDSKNHLTVKNIFNQLTDFKPVIYAKEGTIDDIEVFNLNAPYLLDKLHDEKNRVISQALTFIGLNSTAIDKAERLVRAEANANNGQIQSNIEIGLRSRKLFAEMANEKYGLDIQVDVSRRIDNFNDGDVDIDTDDNKDDNEVSDDES